MEYHRVFNQMDGTDITVEQIDAAVEKIRSSLRKILNKTLFHDMLKGFQVLVMLLDRKVHVHETVIKWLQLFLDVQAVLDPKSERLLASFEKTVPPVVTYIIGCLQHKSQHIPSFHFQLLNMMHKLLANVKMSTIQNLANVESGLVACLWFPIDFVGDFNTQMMILRMLAMVLKCVDDVKQQTELDKIPCPQKHVFNKKLNKIITFANYHEGVFENVARKLLNNYNMNLTKHVLVYSFRCKTLHFGGKIEFFKTLNSQNFWMDLNYCPRSLTFTARAKHNGSDCFNNVSVECHVCGLKLEKQTLIVKFKPPAKLSIDLHNTNLNDMSFLSLELPIDETLRLKENQFVMDYYNDREQADNSTTPNLEFGINNDNNATEDTIMMEKIQNCENININNFQKSYEFLIGQSNDSSDKQNSKIRCGLQNATAQCPIIAPTNLAHTPNEHPPEYLETCDNDSEKLLQTNNNVESIHPYSVCELQNKRRFFKTDKRSWESEVGQGGARKTKVSYKKRCIRRSTQNSKTMPSVSIGIKQVNKVKPMTHLENNTNKPATVQRTLRILRSSTQKCPRQLAARVFRPIAASDDVYDNHYVSDAEPGQSYRSFQERHPFNNETGEQYEADLITAFQENRGIDKQMFVVPQEIKINATKEQNTTLYSGEMEIDVTNCNTHKSKKLIHSSHNWKEPLIPESPLMVSESEEDETTNTKPKNKIVSICSSKNSERLNQTELPECRTAISATMPSPNMNFSLHNSKAINMNDTPTVSFREQEISKASSLKKNKPNSGQILNDSGPTFNKGHCNADFTRDECILYCSRSDGNDSSSDEFENILSTNTNLNVVDLDTPIPIVQRNLATESVITDQVTTTTTSIFSQVKNTRHSRLYSRDVKLTALAATGPVAPLATFGSQRTHSQTDEDGDGISKSALLGQILNQEELSVNQDVLDALEADIQRQFTSSLNQAKEKYVEVYVKKIDQLSESILIEVEKEQNELRELEDMMERVLVQLKIQYETYKEKSQRFQNYSDKMGNLMQTLSKLNLDEQLNGEYKILVRDLQTSAQEKALQQWQAFMQAYTQNFLQKMSRLSNLWEN